MVEVGEECSRCILALPVMECWQGLDLPAGHSPLLGGLCSGDGKTLRYIPESAVCQPDYLQLSLWGEAVIPGWLLLCPSSPPTHPGPTVGWVTNDWFLGEMLEIGWLRLLRLRQVWPNI